MNNIIFKKIKELKKKRKIHCSTENKKDLKSRKKEKRIEKNRLLNESNVLS